MVESLRSFYPPDKTRIGVKLRQSDPGMQTPEGSLCGHTVLEQSLLVAGWRMGQQASSQRSPGGAESETAISAGSQGGEKAQPGPTDRDMKKQTSNSQTPQDRRARV